MRCSDKNAIAANKGRVLCSRPDGRSLTLGPVVGNTRITVGN